MRKRGGKKHRYRDLVKIQYDTSAVSAETQTWSTFADKVPCKVEDVNGQSNYRGVELEDTLSTVVEMHKLEGLKPDMRIVFGDRNLNIVYVKTYREGTARDKHWAFCREVVV